MGFKKGVSGNPKGKPKGALSEKTKAWDSLGDFLTEEGAEKAREIIRNAPPDKFIFYYTMFIEYFKPKRSREDSQGNPENKIVINVNKPNDI
jgi:hypothetical protein